MGKSLSEEVDCISIRFIESGLVLEFSDRYTESRQIGEVWDRFNESGHKVEAEEELGEVQIITEAILATKKLL